MTHTTPLPATADASRASPLTDIRSVQKPTVRLDDLSFDQVVDAFNPLYQIPVVSHYFGDANAEANPLSPLAKMVGGGLLGGVFGLIGAAVNVIFEEATGSSLTRNVLTAAWEPKGEDKPSVSVKA